MRYVLAMLSPLSLLALLAGLLPAGGAGAAEGRRPNIVIILADDLGYSDIGCYGGEVRTPNLDALAGRGLRFTQFYNGGRCCPTRAALMTGLYPHQAGVGRMTMDGGAPGYRGTLGPNTVTIAEALRAAGYRTGMVGKWHLSPTVEGPGHMRHLNNQAILDRFSDPKTYPVARGFESHYGPIWGVVNYFDPFSLVRDAEPVKEVPKGYYITDALSDEAVKFVEERGRGPEPFFLYLAYTAPHWPLHALEEDIKRYEETYKAGWQAVREARHRRMVEMGLLPKGRPTLSPRHEAEHRWEDNPTKEWGARAMAVHAAMIDRMDQGIGRVVAKLREVGALDDTLILFLSDNGASPEAYPNPGFDRPSETRDGRKIAYPPRKDVMPGPETTFFGFGAKWANVANTPFRRWKAEMYEGGICTPMVAHWPRGLTARPGSVTSEVGHVIDVMATCLDAAGAAYPKTFEGRAITPIEGRSLLPVFRGQRRGGQAELGWEHFGHLAYRRGDLKLVARPGGRWELYDVSKDRSELQDLAAGQPETVRELAEAWRRWAERTSVFPLPERAGPLRLPALPEPRATPRRPRDDGELRFWLENMVWHHGYTVAEVVAATGLGEEEVRAALRRFDIRPETRPARAKDAPLLVLPYPGGRHPRIGFLDGAIDPQRETKVSVFAPWERGGYAVVDVPEAISSNLGMLYLAHMHVPTMWTERGVALEALEWSRRADGSLDFERELPNKVRFGAKVVPGRDGVRMELWLTNGTDRPLTGLRVQNCVLLKGLAGFAAQTNENKVLGNPYVAARSEDGRRWVITAWDPCDRPWANPPCPCMHSDPKFPDCPPGRTVGVRGWLSFYEGDDVRAEFRRLETIGWR